jgi:hypothetical protein
VFFPHGGMADARFEVILAERRDTMRSANARALGLLASTVGMAVSMCAATSAESATAAVPAPVNQAQVLQLHNQERALVGTAPLHWSTSLQASAQQWANHLAAIHRLEHSTPGGSGHGENLWWGTKGYFSDSQKVGSWTAEKRYFLRGRKFPDVSSTGRWQDVGHYTQEIWYNTTSVGCAQASDSANDYFVCQYQPPGNYSGQYPLGHA